jgi:hypothetical protein
MGLQIRLTFTALRFDDDLKPHEYYQEVKVTLNKSGDHWLVDRAEWQ